MDRNSEVMEGEEEKEVTEIQTSKMVGVCTYIHTKAESVWTMNRTERHAGGTFSEPVCPHCFVSCVKFVKTQPWIDVHNCSWTNKKKLANISLVIRFSSVESPEERRLPTTTVSDGSTWLQLRFLKLFYAGFQFIRVFRSTFPEMQPFVLCARWYKKMISVKLNFMSFLTFLPSQLSGDHADLP